ncbi:MAG: hypothetical protein HY817_04390 [Candidatus Abawacabacteria bacterium]|nr:hypothetical protein [Candidatus Abawacabacteria bacterium]
MAVPKKKTSKTRTNRRYRTWVSKERKRLSQSVVLVPYGNGTELKPAHIYLDDGQDLRKSKKVAKKTEATPTAEITTKKKPTKAKKTSTKTEESKQAE